MASAEVGCPLLEALFSIHAKKLGLMKCLPPELVHEATTRYWMETTDRSPRDNLLLRFCCGSTGSAFTQSIKAKNMRPKNYTELNKKEKLTIFFLSAVIVRTLRDRSVI